MSISKLAEEIYKCQIANKELPPRPRGRKPDPEKLAAELLVDGERYASFYLAWRCDISIVEAKKLMRAARQAADEVGVEVPVSQAFEGSVSQLEKEQKPLLEEKQKTLHEVLTELGYVTRPHDDSILRSLGQKQLWKGGEIVFVGTANTIWNWLRETKQIKSTAEEPFIERYYYGLWNRPAGYASVPSGYQLELNHKDAAKFRHGVISYDRPLTAQEQVSYELTPILSYDKYVKKVAERFLEYPAEHIEVYNDDPDMFARFEIEQEMRKVLGFVPIDSAEMARSVIELLKEKQEKGSRFEEKHEARVERLHERAKKKREEAEAAYRASHERLEGIPVGQPILVGHHSEKRHRRDLERAGAAMSKATEAFEQVEALERRAKAAESSRAISSDDPNAPDKIKAKIASLEAVHEKMLEANKIVRRGDNVEIELQQLGFDSRKIYDILHPPFGKPGFPSYALQNNNQEISRLKKRLEQLGKAAGEETTTIELDDIKIVDNAEDNRLQIFFPGKPDAEMRERLKRAGFKWAPSVGAWQRYRGKSLEWAKRVLTEKVYYN